MEMNLHVKETGMNDADALNADEPLLFTPKAMDSLEKSIALLRQDADAFSKGTADYYRFLCIVVADNVLLRLDALKQAGLYSRALQPKKADRYAPAFKECLEYIYTATSALHRLLWDLYGFNAYSERSRGELDSLANQVLVSLHNDVVALSKAVDYFRIAYQFPKAIDPGLLYASARTIYTCGNGVQACLAKEPEQAADWLDRLETGCATANAAFFIAKPTACIDCRLNVA